MIRLRHKGDIYFSKKKGLTYPGESKPKDGVVIGAVVAFRVHKNKTFRRAQSGEYDMYSDVGGPVAQGNFDNAKAAIMEGLAWNVITSPAQGTYMFEDLRIRGKDALIQALRDDSSLVSSIRNAVIEKLMTNKTNVLDYDGEETEDE